MDNIITNIFIANIIKRLFKKMYSTLVCITLYIYLNFTNNFKLIGK